VRSWTMHVSDRSNCIIKTYFNRRLFICLKRIRRTCQFRFKIHQRSNCILKYKNCTCRAKHFISFTEISELQTLIALIVLTFSFPSIQYNIMLMSDDYILIDIFAWNNAFKLFYSNNSSVSPYTILENITCKR